MDSQQDSHQESQNQNGITTNGGEDISNSNVSTGKGNEDKYVADHSLTESSFFVKCLYRIPIQGYISALVCKYYLFQEDICWWYCV